ncbi:MAG: hypothetical protein H7840_15285 [Alphaproteobacteria bacterium]
MTSQARIWTMLAWAAAVAGLAACDHFAPESPPAVPPLPVVSEHPAADPPVVRAQPTPRRAAVRRRPPVAAPAPAPAPVVTEEPSGPPFIGLSEHDTGRLLGPPLSEEPDPPGKVWRYGGTGCQLDVYLFPNVRNGDYHALDYTVRGDGGVTSGQCLGRLLAERRQR